MVPGAFKTAEKKTFFITGHQWIIPIISVTWEAKIGRNTVQGHPGKTVFENLASEQNVLEV
jgi:hypothetical protein